MRPIRTLLDLKHTYAFAGNLYDLAGAPFESLREHLPLPIILPALGLFYMFSKRVPM